MPMTQADALADIKEQNPYWAPATLSQCSDEMQALLEGYDLTAEQEEACTEALQSLCSRTVPAWGQSQQMQDALATLMQATDAEAVHTLVMQHAQMAS